MHTFRMSLNGRKAKIQLPEDCRSKFYISFHFRDSPYRQIFGADCVAAADWLDYPLDPL